MLTGTAETDLLLPLFAGGEGWDARLSAFLARLRRRTGGNCAALLTGQGDHADGLLDPALAALVRAGALRAGRVYALAELASADAIAGDARVVRLAGGWLLVAGPGELRAADAALLSALAPYVGAALGQWQADRQAEIARHAAAAALAGAHTGWIALDPQGRVIAAEPGLAAHAEAGGVRLVPGEKLALAGPGVLCEHPRIEAVPGAAGLVLCRIVDNREPASPAAFAALTGLPRREAEFAVALAGGATIAEAGAALGLSLQTARFYSKQVYAKLGLRGQADLARRLAHSAASLAPPAAIGQAVADD